MNKIKSIIGRCYWLYPIVQQLYHAIRKFFETRIIGTKIQQIIWQTRHLREGENWIKTYLNSVQHPHRLLLTNKIIHYQPMESILEIGCNAGPNLILLSTKIPSTALHGIDISKKSIEMGNIYIKEKEIKNIHLTYGKAHNLKQFDNKCFDAVFSDAALIYIGPDLIFKVIDEILRITKKVCIFNEWHSDSINKTSYYHQGHWVHNYRKIFLLHNISENSIRVNKIPNDLFNDSSWSQFGNIIEVIL
jgi:ubiquinone/menaquinone biosynthesis C-methylase UbiE